MKILFTAVLLTASLVFTASCARQPTGPEPLPPAAPPANTTPANITNAPPNEALPFKTTADITNVTTLLPAVPAVQLPEEKPVIFEKRDYVMRGEFYKLYIYADGTVYSVAEKGLRMPVRPPIRTWGKGQISQDELKQILSLFQSEQFAGLAKSYNYAANLTPPFATGDGIFTFTVDFGDLHKSVSAMMYMTPDKGETYPGMPPPLNDIYVNLRAVEKALTVIATENITR